MSLDTEFARSNMIHQQVRCWNVSSPALIDAMKNVPRELFVPEQYAELAFADVMLPVGRDKNGHQHRMLSPQLEGRILQELNVRSTDHVLVVGTATGYLTACLARLARQVTSIDISTDRISLAERRLDEIGISNVELRVQDLFDLPENDRFDAIALTGSLPVYDSRLEAWINPGGRAFVVIGQAPAMEACLIERSHEGVISYRSLFETVIPPLANASKPPPAQFL